MAGGWPGGGGRLETPERGRPCGKRRPEPEPEPESEPEPEPAPEPEAAAAAARLAAAPTMARFFTANFFACSLTCRW